MSGEVSVWRCIGNEILTEMGNEMGARDEDVRTVPAQASRERKRKRRGGGMKALDQ